jgi:imidazolonepropionase-like amidohydrolase
MDAIIDEAHSLGLQAHVHAPTLANAKEVLRAGADGLAHSAADAAIDDEFVLSMRKNQATFTTTLALYSSFAVVSAWMRRWERSICTRSLHRTFTGARRASFGAKTYHAFFRYLHSTESAVRPWNVRRLCEAGISVLDVARDISRAIADLAYKRLVTGCECGSALSALAVHHALVCPC